MNKQSKQSVSTTSFIQICRSLLKTQVSLQKSRLRQSTRLWSPRTSRWCSFKKITSIRRIWFKNNSILRFRHQAFQISVTSIFWTLLRIWGRKLQPSLLRHLRSGRRVRLAGKETKGRQRPTKRQNQTQRRRTSLPPTMSVRVPVRGERESSNWSRWSRKLNRPRAKLKKKTSASFKSSARGPMEKYSSSKRSLQAFCSLWRFSKRTNSASRSKSETPGLSARSSRTSVIPSSFEWIMLSRTRKSSSSCSTTAQAENYSSISTRSADSKNRPLNFTLPMFCWRLNASTRMESSIESN